MLGTTLPGLGPEVPRKTERQGINTQPPSLPPCRLLRGLHWLSQQDGGQRARGHCSGLCGQPRGTETSERCRVSLEGQLGTAAQRLCPRGRPGAKEEAQHPCQGRPGLRAHFRASRKVLSLFSRDHHSFHRNYAVTAGSSGRGNLGPC